MIRVERLENPGAEWDHFVRSQADWTHFHLSGWKRVMESALGHECLYLVARDDRGATLGTLPLVRVRSMLFGHCLVSMPFLNYGGPLGSREAIEVLAARARELGDESAVKLVQLRSRTATAIDWPVSHHKITSVLDLPAEAEDLWNSFRSKLRTDIKRPFRDGIRVEFGPDRLPEFYLMTVLSEPLTTVSAVTAAPMMARLLPCACLTLPPTHVDFLVTNTKIGFWTSKPTVLRKERIVAPATTAHDRADVHASQEQVASVA